MHQERRTKRKRTGLENLAPTKSFSCVQLFSTTWSIQPTRLFCPWDSPGKNTGVGCHALLQGIFPTQGLNPRLFCISRWVLYLPVAPPGKPCFSQRFAFDLRSFSLSPYCPFQCNRDSIYPYHHTDGRTESESSRWFLVLHVEAIYV